MTIGQAAADSNLNLSMRRMYVVTAETQELVEIVDNAYFNFAIRLIRSDDFNFTPIDTVQHHLSSVFLSDFSDSFSPRQMLELEQTFGLQAVLFFFIQKDKAGYYLNVKAVEFPSDVFIQDIDIRLSLTEYDIDGIVKKLMAFVNSLRQLRRDYGFKFHASETGILFLTDDVTLPPLFRMLQVTSTVRRELAGYQISGLRAKVVQQNISTWPLTLRRVDSLLQQTNAKMVYLFSMRHDMIHVYFPIRLGKISIVENTLPLWPPHPGFQRFEVEPDSAFGRVLANSLYPQTFGGISALVPDWQGRGEAAKALFLKNIQTIQNSHTTHSFDDSRALSLLYDALAQLYPKADREYGWIELNHADLLKKMQKFDESLNASRPAFDNFQNRDNNFGQLFALVQIADTYEQLQRLDEAESTYQQALAFAQNIKDEHTTALIYFRLGSINFNANRLIEAWEKFDSSAESYLNVGDTLKVVQLNTKLGTLMRQSGFLKKSIDYLQSAELLSRYVGRDRERADADYQLAVTLKENGQVDDAFTYFQSAGDLMEILADTVALANIEEHMGDILFDNQEWKKAQGHFEYAARFYNYIPDVEGVIRSLVKSADTSVSRERWPRAQADYDEALEYANLYEKKEWSSIILYKKGLAHVREGKYALGQEELELARQADVSPEAIDAFMKSVIREVEQELENRSNENEE
jgi:tetratricopeptide (TPR) repeat protein